jgi:hypothetical protein
MIAWGSLPVHHALLEGRGELADIHRHRIGDDRAEGGELRLIRLHADLEPA